MDEASSKFVDQLVMDKLLTEKLELVTHLPTHSFAELPKTLFADSNELCSKGVVLEETPSQVLFQSPVQCHYEENRRVAIQHFKAEETQGTILLTHGLFEDNRDIYTFLIKGLNEKGYDVYLTTLPFHYDRCPNESSFSGEYFWSADIIRTTHAFKQAVYELYQISHYIREKSAAPIYLAGFSMGASVALTTIALWEDEMPPLFAINPAAGLSDIVWDSPLCRTIKRDFLTGGYSMEELKKAYALFEPKSLIPRQIDSNSICLAYALFDQVTAQYQYENLIKSWKLSTTIPYKAGHLNTLRVPRLANDMASFFATKELQSNEYNN